MYNDLKNGTVIKFNSWNDQLSIGVINNFENGKYKVSINSRIGNVYLLPNEIIGIIDKSLKFSPVEEPVEEPVIIKVIEKPIAEPKKPVFQGIFADGGVANLKHTEGLPNELAIFIEEYDDKGKPLNKSVLENRISQIKNFLKKHFGKFTMSDKSNSHIDSKGELVMKSSILISSYPSDDEFNANKEKLINFLSLCAKDWGVEEIILLYEEDNYFILPTEDMMKQGGELWIQDAVNKMKKKGTFGAFTKQAKTEGLTPIEFTKKILKNPKGYTVKTRRRANFVKNMNINQF
jgi:hypothetical protein